MADEVTPVAAEPVAPVVAPVDVPTADEVADTNEWETATKELFPGIKSTIKKDPKEDEQTVTTATTTEAPTTTETTTVDPNETPKQKAEREAKEAADAEAVSQEDEEPNTAARDARVAARESAQQVEAVKADVREKMFANTPQVLQDADGDPIRVIEDVMKLVNPRTNEPFTEEEAGMWLISAQQKFNQNLAQMEKQIDDIADVNVDLKDQADAISEVYGELLKAMPDLQKSLWTEYEKTLVKDSTSNIITKAPVSLKNFYDIQLKPYQKLAEQLENQEDAKLVQEQQVAEEEKKKKERADRSDIYGGGNVNTMDEEEKGWSEAATAVFGPKK